MNLTLNRLQKKADGILSELKGGQNSWVTLSHAFLVGKDSAGNNLYEPKLPPGVYECVRGTHHIHHTDEKTGEKILVPIETFEITGIPDFEGNLVSGVLFHPGNYNEQSDGCELMGKAFGYRSDRVTRMTMNSKVAFEELMKSQEGVDKFILTVV